MKRIEPAPGQESVWDYPRPPACEPSTKQVVVIWGGSTVASSSRTFRVLETSHPPGWYIPREDVTGLVRSSAPATVCEWKGRATYWDLVGEDGKVLRAVAWSYENPVQAYSAITGHIAFMPTHLTCSVDGELVRPQEGGFYGGWITDDVVGPFKGAPGTWGW